MGLLRDFAIRITDELYNSRHRSDKTDEEKRWARLFEAVCHHEVDNHLTDEEKIYVGQCFQDCRVEKRN